MEPVMRGEMIKWLLRQSMGEELVASSEYHQRAIISYQDGDTETADLFTHIADEENNHYKEFANRLLYLGGVDIYPLPPVPVK